MTSTRAHAPAGSGAGGRGAVMKVPSTAAPPLTAAELATLSQAERAARALESDRTPREVPIDRAFLEAALDLRLVIRTIVAAFVPRFADWCFVDLLDAEGVPRRVEVAPADPDQAGLAAEMLSLGFGPGWATPSAQAIRDRAPRLYREVSPELMAWATHDERHLAVFRAMGPRSLVAVPLVARERVLGAVTLVRSTMVPGFDEWTLVVAGEIAAPAALAIDVARTFAAEREARTGAEQHAQPARAARPAKAKAKKKAPPRRGAKKARRGR